MVNGDTGKGFVLGVAATLLLPLAVTAARPRARAALKGGVLAYERGRELLAELGETVDDLVAEVRAEMEEEAAQAEAGEPAADPAADDAAADTPAESDKGT